MNPERRAAHRRRMTIRRHQKQRRKECRDCIEPAFVDPATGRVMRKCRRHLDLDLMRKTARKAGTTR